MEQRPYFILGDAFVNSVTGALVALVCTALFGPAWNMWLSMLVGMAAPADLSVAAGRGALVGLVCLAVTYAANAALTRASDS